MTLPGGTRFAAAATSGSSTVRSFRPRSLSLTSPFESRKRMQRKPSHLTSKRYSAELNGASADAACIGRSSSGKLSSSIWSRSLSGCICLTLGAVELRSFTTSPGLGGRLLTPRALLLGLLYRLAQGFHKIHDLGRLRRLGRLDHLALRLGMDNLHDRLAVVVLVAAGVEAVGQALDERLRHLELLGVDLHLVLEALEALGRADLVWPVKRVHDQALAVGVKRGEVLLVAQRDLGDGHAACPLERLAEQLIGLLAKLFRLDVVGAVEVEARLDVVDRDELLDVDGVLRRKGEIVQVLVLDDHVPVLAHLVAAQDLAVLDLVVRLCAPALVGDGGVMIGAQLTEGDLRCRLGRVIEADRDRNHPEGDDAFPHRSRHGDAVYLLFLGLAIFRRSYAPTSRLCMTSIELPSPARASRSIRARLRLSTPVSRGVPNSLKADRSCTQAGSL